MTSGALRRFAGLLLAGYDKRIAAFAENFQRKGWDALRDTNPASYGFLCRHYQICLAP